MKKTAQTLLTAAIFATALGNSAPSQFRQPVQALGNSIVEVQTNFAGAYGPPPVQLTTETTPVEDLSYWTTVAIYAPPWAGYLPGDVNMDNKYDARDLSVIKQLALKQDRDFENSERYLSDINYDGKVNEDDVHTFMERSLGIPKKEEPAVTTTDVAATALVTTTALPVTSLYGPPVAYTTSTETTTVPETDIIPVPVYGPPSMMT
ncbi:MAG: dockerin type I repeat-containing protein [Oscillospiraceae bacterium]|nr:dockerin type I repeat-containing protein [Oscillospiraceae bacterium]